ncbi:MAG: ABC transporter permease [Alphaproteobacteria bacterium]|nr:ABC transporter permease [Alphaproteobacteria bacterium]
MMRLIRLRGLWLKELYQIVRDPSSILVAFFLPLLILFLNGYALSLDFNNIKTGIVIESPSTDANKFLAGFIGSPYFNVTVSENRKDIEALLVAGKIRGMIVIPENFDKDNFEARFLSPIQILTDGSEPNTAAVLENYTRGVWQNWLIQKAQEKGEELTIPINIESRIWYNQENISPYAIIPGSLALIITLVGNLLTALVVAREWERGTMESLMTTPVSILELIFGKLIPYFVLGLGTLCLCVAVSIFIYHVPFRGSIFLILLVGSLYLLAALTFGLLISTLARNQFIAAQVSIFTAFLPAFLLSGFLFEISNMPLPIQAFSYIFTARYLVSSLQTLFLVGNVWQIVLFDCSCILAILLILMFLVLRSTRKRLD